MSSEGDAMAMEEAVVHRDKAYRADPALREYYVALPGEVQIQLCRAAGPISTLGELQSAAEHLKQGWRDQMGEERQE